jgi:glycosyltransferase involved in cell wall biosynthesis
VAKIVIDARELRTSTGRYVERLLYYLQQVDTENSYKILLAPKDIEGWKPSNRKFAKVACKYKEFSFGEQLGMLKQLHHLKADLVHFPMAQQPILYGGKVVTTIQDLTTARFRNPNKNWLVFTIKQQVYKFVIYWTAHKSAQLITPSEYVKNDVARYTRINSRKVTVTLEAADFITDEAEPISDLEGKAFIMYVGRPQPHKNLDRLISAFAILRQSAPNLRLVLVGKTDSLYRQLHKQTDRLGIKNVVFTGFVNEGQLRWLYEHSEAYVFPSMSEGFGLGALEAMRYGAPVVSSNATCLPEIYKDAAVYFDPIDIEEMAHMIETVLKDPQLRKHLISRGKVVAGSYSWKRMAEQTLGVYKEALNQT